MAVNLSRAYCEDCGTDIMPETYLRTGGYCMVCRSFVESGQKGFRKLSEAYGQRTNPIYRPDRPPIVLPIDVQRRIDALTPSIRNLVERDFPPDLHIHALSWLTMDQIVPPNTDRDSFLKEVISQAMGSLPALENRIKRAVNRNLDLSEVLLRKDRKAALRLISSIPVKFGISYETMKRLINADDATLERTLFRLKLTRLQESPHRLTDEERFILESACEAFGIPRIAFSWKNWDGYWVLKRLPDGIK